MLNLAEVNTSCTVKFFRQYMIKLQSGTKKFAAEHLPVAVLEYIVLLFIIVNCTSEHRFSNVLYLTVCTN